MANFRLINCSFVNAGSFKVNVSNKAKLLYLLMLTSGDDLGFVDTTNDLINTLESNDNDLGKSINLELLENTYNTALCELIDKGYVYEFVDNHNNKIHLIRHWFLHNKYINGLWTNYKTFRSQVHLESGEYILGKKPLKENEIKENNINENKINQSEVNDDEYFAKPKQKKKQLENDDDFTEDDLPFTIDKGDK